MKTLRTRIITKHETPEGWYQSSLIPYQGEIIIYDPGYDPLDGKTYTRERMKIGDGSKRVSELPFIVDIQVSKTAHAVVTQSGAIDYSPATWEPPSLTQSVDKDTLLLTFNTGNYIPASLTQQEDTIQEISVVTNVTT